MARASAHTPRNWARPTVPAFPRRHTARRRRGPVGLAEAATMNVATWRGKPPRGRALSGVLHPANRGVEPMTNHVLPLRDGREDFPLVKSSVGKSVVGMTRYARSAAAPCEEHNFGPTTPPPGSPWHRTGFRAPDHPPSPPGARALAGGRLGQGEGPPRGVPTGGKAGRSSAVGDL